MVRCMHVTTDYPQFYHVGGQVDTCKLGLFQNVSFAIDMQYSTSNSGVVLCFSGNRTFVSVSWLMCKKQVAVSHGSTETDVVSLDAELRMEGLPAYNFWECIVDVFEPANTAEGDATRNHSQFGQLLFIDIVPSNILHTSHRPGSCFVTFSKHPPSMAVLQFIDQCSASHEFGRVIVATLLECEQAEPRVRAKSAFMIANLETRIGSCRFCCFYTRK